MLGEIAAGAKIVATIAKGGYEALKRLQPEYGRFWKQFESKLKPESRDIPWERLAELKLDPDFVGQACGLIRGDNQKRREMRQAIGKLAVPPEGSRYDTDEVVEIVMRAADRAAVKAAREDRDVTAAQSALIRGVMGENQEELRQALARFEEELARQGGKIDELAKVGAPPRQVEPPREQGVGEARGTRPPSLGHRQAEQQLGEILKTDPNVGATLEPSALIDSELPYRPDLIVQDEAGINWLVEVKDEAALRLPNVQKHVGRFAALTTEAARSLPDDWRFALVTPESVSGADTWSEVLSRSSSLTGGVGGSSLESDLPRG